MKKVAFLIWDIEYGGGGERVTEILAERFSTQYEVSVFSVCRCSDRGAEGRVRYHSILDTKLMCNEANIVANQNRIEDFLRRAVCDTLIVQEGKLAYYIDFNALSASRNNLVVHHYNPVALIDGYSPLTYYLSWERSPIKRIAKTVLYPLIRWKGVRKARQKARRNMLQAIHHSTRTIMLCDQAKELVLELVGDDYAPNIEVVPNSIFLPQAHDVIRKDKIAIFVGRVEVAKGINDLVAVWSNVVARHPEARLLVVGRAEDRQLAAKIGRLPGVELMGYCDQMEQLYAQADVVLHTSYTEGFPMVLLESMAWGVVPMAFDCHTGPNNLITNGTDGFVVCRRNRKAFAAVLNEWFCASAPQKQAVREAAVQTAKKYETEVVCRQWFEII